MMQRSRRVTSLLTCSLVASLVGLTAPPDVRAQAPVGQSPVDMAKLRQAAAFPVISVNPSVVFTAQEGYRSSSDKRDLPAEIAALQKTLTGGAAGRYRLGQLYNEASDPVHAKEAYLQSAALYRRRLAARPDDGLTLAALGTSLSAAGRNAEAETVLRRAARLAPGRAKVWTALGDFLASRAGAALLSPSPEAEGADFAFVFGAGPSAMAEKAGAFIAKYGQATPTAAQAARAQSLLAEARACYDRAVAAQPRSADAYIARVGFRVSMGAALQGMIAAFQPAGTVNIAAAMQNGEKDMAAAWASAPPLSDLREAARLAPNDLSGVGLSAMFGIMASKLRQDAAGQTDWSALPGEARRPAEEAMRPLEALARSAGADKETAAKASEAVGILWLIVGNGAAADAPLRRAVALDPSRESAWDGLTMILVGARDYAGATSLLEARVRVLDTARGHLLLAKVYDKTGQPEKEAAQVQAALADDPDDLTANIARAALLLRHGGDAATLEQARRQIFKTDALYRKAPQSLEAWKDETLMASIYHALTGDAASAREKLDQILSLDKDYGPAKQALAALGFGNPKTS